jgi:hypothetical protein
MFKKCKKGILFLCLALVITTICSTPVSASVPKKAYSVTFNGKTKTLIKLSDTKKDSYTGSVSPDSLKKAWGKYTRKDRGDGITDYVFKKGSSKITLSSVEGVTWWSVELTLKDKNAAFCGVKVGQTKAKAVKNLQTVFGKSPVKSTSKLITLEFSDDEGYPGYLEITIKSGKVSKIFFFAS